MDATVSKGQRSINEIASLSLRLAPARFSFSRAVIGGAKIFSHVLCASLAVSLNGASCSNALHSPWFRLYFDIASKQLDPDVGNRNNEEELTCCWSLLLR